MTTGSPAGLKARLERAEFVLQEQAQAIDDDTLATAARKAETAASSVETLRMDVTGAKARAAQTHDELQRALQLQASVQAAATRVQERKRTFLPALSLLILDEPNAAMDAERTSQVLGFVAGCGFDQVLIVSHDEMTVDVADHIITLENG